MVLGGSSRRTLAGVSALQLGCGLTGQVLALSRRHPYDLPLLHGRPEAVARDSVLMGTALSAPAVMMAAQVLAVGRLRRNGDPRAARLLGVLGLLMVGGYLGERLDRHRLSPAGWDPVESPLVGAGVGLAAAMALLGLRRPAQPAGAAAMPAAVRRSRARPA